MARGAAVWDIPTRLFHWMLVLLLALSWWSAENGAMEWHYRSGLGMLALLVFRLIWGFVGGSTARFAGFIYAPSAVLAQLRRPNGATSPSGHGPLGGYSVAAMLLALAAQVGTGLFSVDIDGIESGPLSYLVTFDQGRVAAEIHEFSFNLLLTLIVLHILAILYYRLLRKRDLITPMLTGRDPQLPTTAGELKTSGAFRFVLAGMTAFAIAWWIGKA